MQRNVSIIGSFQKYYPDVLKAIHQFQEAGLGIESPRGNYITGSIDAFVIFDNDKENYTPEEIEMVTLARILRSDWVYVYDLDGYVGKTTCAEIGACFVKNKPMFFLERPKDLPFPVTEQQIISPTDFVKYVQTHNPTPVANYGLCAEATQAVNQILGKEIQREDSEPEMEM